LRRSTELPPKARNKIKNVKLKLGMPIIILWSYENHQQNECNAQIKVINLAIKTFFEEIKIILLLDKLFMPL
jgi:hypothetical protein